MDRRNFLLKGTTLSLAAGSIGLGANIYAAPYLVKGIDNLINEKGEYILSPLPYDYNALEPYMDAETLNLHHTFHHGGAVKALNKDVQKIKAAMEQNETETVSHWVRKFSHHSSSHVLHTIFWSNLSPKGGGEPKGDLLKRINFSFGSFDKLKSLLSAISKDVDGSGWGILAYHPAADQLVIFQCENHEKLTQW